MVPDTILTLASEKYGFDKETLHPISNSTNKIYYFKKNGKGYILRFANRSAEQIHQVKAEMDWLYYLSKNKVSVSLPLHTKDRELVFLAQENSENYIITAFEMASGRFWNKNDPNFWNEKIFYNWGKSTGDLHRWTKEFKPVNDIDVRDTFDGRFSLACSVKDCPSVNKIIEELIIEMMELPKDKDSYGLIHNDIHPWNFYIEDGKINLFDFDDCLYGWFALDIGIALYHGLWWGRKNDSGNDFTNIMIKNFLDGYLSANHLSNFWLGKIPMFMKFRQICKFSWFFNPDNIDEHQKERIHNIENNILFTNCDIDYSLFSK